MVVCPFLLSLISDVLPVLGVTTSDYSFKAVLVILAL
jgi:hypothetical protein